MERHDLYNFESKIDYRYTLEKKNRKKTSYLLDTYFFIPKSLQINKESYSKENFFSDLNNRIRFKTPQMSIDGILDEKNNLSPLNVISQNIKYFEYGKIDINITRKIQREFRLLACIIKATLRDQFTYFFENYKILKESYNISDLLESYIEGLKKFRAKLTIISEKFTICQIPYELRETFRYADEYISLQLERWLTSSLTHFELEINQKVKQLIKNLINKEQSYRNCLESRLTLKKNSDNEDFSYIEGIMKKYVQGVLYLEKKKKDPKSSSLEILYSIAAGLTMFLSLFLGIILLLTLEVNSIPFILGLAVIYMLKDRLKDNIRGFSQKAIGFLFPDQIIDIFDGFYDEIIGESKEKLLFFEWNKIPQDILNIRMASNKSPIESEGKPEICMVYRKRITLFNQRIDKFHTRQKDISDVIRFNMNDFLKYADDPIQKEISYNANKDKFESISISKVYHVNVILKLMSIQNKNLTDAHFKKFRIILDQKGIKRVEEPEILL